MRYFLIGSKKDVVRYLGKNPTADAFEIEGDVLAVIVGKLPVKKDNETVGVSVVSEDKFVRFLETNNGKPVNEKKEEPLPAE